MISWTLAHGWIFPEPLSTRTNAPQMARVEIAKEEDLVSGCNMGLSRRGARRGTLCSNASWAQERGAPPRRIVVCPPLPRLGVRCSEPPVAVPRARTLNDPQAHATAGALHLAFQLRLVQDVVGDRALHGQRVAPGALVVQAVEPGEEVAGADQRDEPLEVGSCTSDHLQRPTTEPGRQWRLQASSNMITETAASSLNTMPTQTCSTL